MREALGFGVDHCAQHLHRGHRCWLHSDTLPASLEALGAGALALFAWRIAAPVGRTWRAGRAATALGRVARSEGGVVWVRGTSLVCHVVGLISPQVYVSESLARDLEPASLDVVLDHERAHVARRDPAVGLLVSVAAAFGLPWVSARWKAAWRQAAEQAADAEAARAHGPLAVVQPLSISGEGRAARREATARVQAAEHALARARFEAAAEARLALSDAIARPRDAELARAAVERARGVREAVEDRVAVGDAPEVDAQLARLTEAAAVGEWLAAVRERDRSRVALLAATGLADYLELTGDPLEAAPAGGAAGPARSDVMAAETEVDAARSGLKRENAAALPPVGVGVWAQWQNVGVGPGPEVPPWNPTNVGTTVGPAISVEVPLWHRNEGGRAQARGDLAAATSEAEVVRATAEAEQRTIASRRAEIEAVIGAMPAVESTDAEAAVASIREAYTEGQLSGLEVTLWLDRIGAAERAVVAARREAAVQRIERALAEEWPTLLGARP